MTVDTKTLVTTMSFLLGIDSRIIHNSFPENYKLLDELFTNNKARIIRYLCRIRTVLMQKFKHVDREIMYELKNLDTMQYFKKCHLKELKELGIDIVKSNHRAGQYQIDVNQYIAENIDGIRDLFPDWLNWEYIKDLFIIPHYTKQDVLKKEFAKYMANIEYYPFQHYMHWKPQNVGGLFFSDRKFLKIIYESNNDIFNDTSKYKDAHEDTKNNIYNFVAASDKTVIVVDCENADIYKLFSCLQGLNDEELEKVEKIILYDDYHTTVAWEHLNKYVKLQVERIQVERVLDRKSLVDIMMTAGVCRHYFENKVDSFILISSDSDFWGLISSLPEANFLVMYEYEKCSGAIKEALNEKGIYYCAIDDFCTANIDKFKKLVLFSILEKYLPDIAYINGKDLLNKIYCEARIMASETEKKAFFDKHIKTIQLKCDKEGNFSFEIKK